MVPNLVTCVQPLEHTKEKTTSTGRLWFPCAHCCLSNPKTNKSKPINNKMFKIPNQISIKSTYVDWHVEVIRFKWICHFPKCTESIIPCCLFKAKCFLWLTTFLHRKKKISVLGSIWKQHVYLANSYKDNFFLRFKFY